MIHSGPVRFHDDLAGLLMPIDDIGQHPDNPNNGDVEAVMSSIETNGMYRPVFVQRSTKWIVAGNHTWQACKELGAAEIPVVWLDVDETEAAKIMLADNRIATLAVPDPGLLLNLLDRLAEQATLTGTGYNDYDLEVIRHLAEIPTDYDHTATWALLSVRLPPHVMSAYREMTREADGERGVLRVADATRRMGRKPMIAQDSTDPTGVAAPKRVHGDGTQDIAARRARARKANAAVQMRLAGATWGEIAEALGYPTPRQALVATEKALEKQLRDESDKKAMRALAGARLERLLRSVWSKAIDPDNPDHLVAAGRALAIADRHIKLFGLDAPAEIVVHSPTMTEIERWVAAVLTSSVDAVPTYDIIAGEVVEEEPRALPAG